MERNIGDSFKMLVLWIFSLIVISAFSYMKISESMESSLGERAEVIAMSIADSLHVDEDKYAQLLSLDFEELLDSEFNIRFEQVSRKYMLNTDVKYIYLASIVSDSEARYSVTENEARYHDVDKSTRLNKVYVLDAVESVNTRLRDLEGNWYVDRDRYELVNGTFKDMYSREASGYRKTSSSWGEYITGYAPAYSAEGNYIGLIGVDIYMESYYADVNEYVYMASMFILFNTILGIASIYFMERSKRDYFRSGAK